MKVLLINGSPRAAGCTNEALTVLAETLRTEGVETEIFWLGKDPVQDCVACGGCKNRGRCVFDDVANALIERAKGADGLIFGTPVYYAHPSGRVLSVLDRAFYAGKSAFAGKPGACVVSARRGGTAASFDVLNKYFGLSQMPVAGSPYWNIPHALTAEDVPHDEEGLQTLRNLARNLVWMMRCFAAGRDAGISPPQAESGACTNFIDRGGRPYPEG